MSLILCTEAFVRIFGMSRTWALASRLGCYLPAIFVLLNLASVNIGDIAATCGLMIGLAPIAWLYESSEEKLKWAWFKSHELTRQELEKKRRTDVLKNHFPAQLREMIEMGTLVLENQIVIKSAVVGFADIVSSTRISNAVDLNTDWELKDRFLTSAAKRAKEFDIIVLTHLGDGFLFVANYPNPTNWPERLTSFYQTLTSDFRDILEEMKPKIGGVRSGIRFGVARGPTLLGWLGEGQSYFTAIGPEVNLAARLCREAGHNELVVSARTWDYLGEISHKNEFATKSYRLKGFTKGVTATQLRSEFIFDISRDLDKVPA